MQLRILMHMLVEDAQNKTVDLGMPSLEDNNVKGILYVTFDVEFPRGELTQEQKATIREILKQDTKPKSYNGYF